MRLVFHCLIIFYEMCVSVVINSVCCCETLVLSDSGEGKKKLEGEQATVQPQAYGSLSSHMSFIYFAHVLGRLQGPDFHLKSVLGPVFWFFLEKLHPVHLKMVGTRVGWAFVVCLLFELVDFERGKSLSSVEFFFFSRCLKLRFLFAGKGIWSS